MLFFFIMKICKQVAVYLTFGANSAAFEAALFALTGSEAFQWMKVCNRFTRFCHLIGGALLSGFVASLLMALISTISAYNVFRMYSPKWFMRLKGKWNEYSLLFIAFIYLYCVKFATTRSSKIGRRWTLHYVGCYISLFCVFSFHRLKHLWKTMKYYAKVLLPPY